MPKDCAAEVRLHLLQHLQQGRTLSFAYAVRVAQGVLADFVQAQQRQPPAIPLKDADSHGGREPSLELRAAVRWALEQLPPDARALVWLHDVEGYTAEELTERFGCSAACLRQRCTAPANGCANCWNEPSGSIYSKLPPNLLSPCLSPDEGTGVRYEISGAGAPFCPSLPLAPLSREAGEGECASGRTAVRPYTPLPPCGRGAGGEGEQRTQAVYS